jgi:hypothetical protein
VKNPYENLMFWIITQDPSLPHIQELTRLIEDAAQQESEIAKLRSENENLIAKTRPPRYVF